jgi:serine/threonine-protein kinase HipA
MRKGHVYINDDKVGDIVETIDGDFTFKYDPSHLKKEKALAVSRTLPLRTEPYRSATLFPFFDGLIPEGWLLDVASRNWKVAATDRMGLLLSACEDCIGNVSVRQASEDPSQ